MWPKGANANVRHNRLSRQSQGARRLRETNAVFKRKTHFLAPTAPRRPLAARRRPLVRPTALAVLAQPPFVGCLVDEFRPKTLYSTDP